MDVADLGVAARARRRELGLSQRDLADLADVSERFVRDLESGKPGIRLDKVLAVLRGLGLVLDVHRRGGE